jgi:sn-glycerol 3-phosphate transport system substrate-binding protein
MKHHAITFAALAALAGWTVSAQAVTEINVWHSMTGALGDRVSNLAAEFNKTQSDYKVNAVYKGSYAESMQQGVAAFRAGNAPHVIQVFEVGTATMMAAKGAIKPVAEMMKESGEKWDQNVYIPAVAGY